jgi:hypothetical protein
MMGISGFGIARPLRAAFLCAGLASAFAAQAVVFSNPASISIPDSGTATPYPSPITASGLTGPITKVTATLNGLTHGCESDLAVLLVGPQGQSVILMADAGSCGGTEGAVFTFDDAYGAIPRGEASPDSGSYAPTDLHTEETMPLGAGKAKVRPTGPAQAIPAGYMPPPAPADAPTGTTMAIFNGTSGNGTWNLYVLDQYSDDSGSISGGWSLNITAPAAAGGAVAVPTLGQWSLILLATLLAGVTAVRLRKNER